DRGGDHLLEVRRIDGRDMLVQPLDLEAQAGGEIFLIADHHIDILRDVTVDLLRPLLAALALPQAGAVVEVIGVDCAVFARRFDRLDHRFGGIGGQRRENAAGMEPAHAFLAEQLFPVHFARPDLRGGAVAAVRAAQGGADAETLFGEVQADAGVAAQAVEIAPDDVRGINAALADEILHQPAKIVPGQGGDDAGALAPAFAHGAGDI